jgi:ATP-dependent protease ClpP protease subunit
MTNKVPDGTPSKSRYLVFIGPIASNATRFLRNACCTAVNDKVTDLTSQFSSSGGTVDEGFSLYEFLLSLPLTLTMHNIGIVNSVAIIVFLAGDKRFANDNTIFYMHDETWTTLGAREYTSSKLKEYTYLLESSRLRAKSILKLRTKLDESVLESPDFFKEPIPYQPGAAKSAGIIHEIQDARVPFGEMVLNIDWV